MTHSSYARMATLFLATSTHVSEANARPSGSYVTRNTCAGGRYVPDYTRLQHASENKQHAATVTLDIVFEIW